MKASRMSMPSVFPPGRPTYLVMPSSSRLNLLWPLPPSTARPFLSSPLPVSQGSTSSVEVRRGTESMGYQIPLTGERGRTSFRGQLGSSQVGSGPLVYLVWLVALHAFGLKYPSESVSTHFGRKWMKCLVECTIPKDSSRLNVEPSAVLI